MGEKGSAAMVYAPSQKCAEFFGGHWYFPVLTRIPWVSDGCERYNARFGGKGGALRGQIPHSDE
ncbi:hypothetical protein SAMN04488077_10768 [Roseovarius tolerans]|uniref:Uncharacterized protein n=1 Tax=Roseovarius tolerans TaxID=74031 RepID=A0A1H8AMH9_9RHOB|nr:hypothetical protein SAMN04488077_10768 [Roseovarius tolerans]